MVVGGLAVFSSRTTPEGVLKGPAAQSPIADMTPTRLVIARIGIDANVEARGLDSSRNLDVAKDFHDVAWYDLGPAPGQPGNALINGHVNWWTGSAVFTRLPQIRTGDEVLITHADGTTATFKVTARRTVAWNARIASLFAPGDTATLTLITCTGVWNPFIGSDSERLLVSAVLE
jgi:LPXTG-site transpeptidase (sortase) family protein